MTGAGRRSDTGIVQDLNRVILCPTVRAVRQRCIRGIAVTRVVWPGTG